MKNLLNWLLTGWLVLITVRFASTTWKTLHNPFNPGDDKAWFWGWLALTGLIALGAWLLPTRKLWIGVLAACGLTAAAMLVLSHVWLGAVIAVAVLLICAVSGIAILSCLGLGADNVLAIPLGMAPVMIALFLLSLAGQLHEFAILAVLLLGALPVILPGVRKGIAALRPTFGISRECVLPAILIAVAALLNLTWAVVPEVQFDALNYHLAVPQAYVAAHGLVDLRFLHAYLAKMTEFVFAGVLSLGGVPAVKFFVFALGLCAASATYALGKTLFEARTGMWAAALFYTTPIVGWLTGTVYIDNIVAFFCAAVLLAFVKWFHSREANWFVVASIIGGVAVGTKINAVFALLVVLPVMAFGVLKKWRVVAGGAFGFLLIALPAHLLTWVQTGNPVFPMFNAVFKSPLWPEEAALVSAANFGLPATLSNLGVFVFRLTLDSTRFGEAMPRGALGISLLFAVFGVLLLPRLGKAAGILVGAVAVYLVALFYTMQYGRYYVAILPAVAVIAAGTAFKGASGRNRLVEACLLVGIVTAFPAFSTQYWAIPERFPVRAAFGVEDRDAFARRALQGYEGVQRLNGTLKEGDRVLGIDVEPLRFYLNAPLVSPSISLLDDPVRPLSFMKPDAQLAEGIRKAGFTHLFVTSVQLHRSPPGYPYLEPAFLDAFATLEFSDSGVSVYRFRQ